jgi:hypothetical protein
MPPLPTKQPSPLPQDPPPSPKQKRNLQIIYPSIPPFPPPATMCSASEIHYRTSTLEISSYESTIHTADLQPNKRIPDERICIKKYRRSAAGGGECERANAIERMRPSECERANPDMVIVVRRLSERRDARCWIVLYRTLTHTHTHTHTHRYKHTRRYAPFFRCNSKDCSLFNITSLTHNPQFRLNNAHFHLRPHTFSVSRLCTNAYSAAKCHIINITL